MSNLDGQTLGKYQMIERLGRGGMADVYKAYQPGLDRYVAIKVLHPHLSEDKDFITRFQREAKSVAKLRHPNIIQVFDFDSQGEQYFMVMEFVEGGQSLKEYLQALSLRGEHIPLAASAELAAKMADALDYAHKEGMVHRDIKPANVLLPSIDKPLLGDFGIARIVGQTSLTAEGAMIGTPAYMSPEQGRGEPADERSDIYALGIILYELITNQPPYDADTPYGVILKHMNDPLISPREFVADVPDSVERVVLKSLAKAPADRYESAGAMRDALNAALSELGSATQQAVSTTPLKKGGTGATQVSPANAGTTQYASGKRPADEAMTQQVAVQAGTSLRKGVPVWVWVVVGIVVLALVGGGLFATGILGGLAIGSSGVPSAPTAQGQPPTANQNVEGLSEADQASALQGFELISTWDPDESLPIFEALSASYPDNPDMSAAKAMAMMQDDRLDEAMPILTSLELGGVDTQMVNLAVGMSYYWREEGSFEKAMEYLSKSIEQCDGNVHLCIYALQERTWMQWYEDRNFDLAFADISRAFELAPTNTRKADILDSRADLLESAGFLTGATDDMVKAYELENREAPWYLEEAARLSAITGDFGRAQEFYTELREKDPGNSGLLAGEAYIKFRTGDLEKATELVNLAIERDPAINQPHYLLALMAYDAGDYDGALEQYQIILDSENPDDYSWPFYNVANGHQITFDRAQAVLAKGDVDTALALIDQTLEEDSWWPHPYVVRAAIYKNRGEIEKARIELTQAMEIARDWNRQDIIDWVQGFLDELD